MASDNAVPKAIESSENDKLMNNPDDKHLEPSVQQEVEAGGLNDGKRSSQTASLSTPSPDAEKSEDVEIGKTEPADLQEEKAAIQDSNVVDFDGPNDPTKAVNWSVSKKWATVGILSFLTLVT